MQSTTSFAVWRHSVAVGNISPVACRLIAFTKLVQHTSVVCRTVICGALVIGFLHCVVLHEFVFMKQSHCH